MADNEHLHERPAVPPVDLPPVPAPAPPSASQPATEITPEQVRQFQDFQRFQALMRDQAEKSFTTAKPTFDLLQPSGLPPKSSLPKRLLKATASKAITGLVVLAVLVLAGYLAIDYFFGESHDHLPASETGGGKAETNLIFETDPKIAVLKVYDDIAQGDAKSACSRFTHDARTQFTKNMSQYGNSCTEIVLTIYEAVTAGRMKAEYADPWIPVSAVRISGDFVSVSSCAIEVVGGPRLGLLTLSKIPKSEARAGGDAQWIVSGQQAEPADCGGTVSTLPTS